MGRTKWREAIDLRDIYQMSAETNSRFLFSVQNLQINFKSMAG